MKRGLSIVASVACILAVRTHASAEWRPPELHATTASLTEVLSTYAKAAGTPDARYAERRER